MEAGATMPQTSCGGHTTMPTHSWAQVPGDRFRVRQGPNYSAAKLKAPSASSFYEPRGVDWYTSDRKVDGVAAGVNLPKPEFHHPLVPSLLVVNIQLPLEAPRVLKGSKLDGPTLHVVFYFTLKETTVAALDDLETASPSLRLLAQYFRRAENEPDARKRFKAVAYVNNLEQVKMQRLLSSFNGKPVLITESGSLLRGIRRARGENAAVDVPDAVPGGQQGGAGGLGGSGESGSRSFGPDDFLEMDIHVRRWNFMARKGLQQLIPKFSILNVSIAFLVEGRADSELPEQVLGCLTINALDVSKARALNV